MDSKLNLLSTVSPNNHHAHLHQTRLLGYGSLFGEVSLVTDSPYFTSTYAIEPTALICINKHTFDRIYNKDKTKLAEIRIRLVGTDVELQHILNHPKCNKLFVEYLKKQVAVENIYFLNAVAKFDDMTERLKKEMWKVIHEYASSSGKIRQQWRQAAVTVPANATEVATGNVLSTIHSKHHHLDTGRLRRSNDEEENDGFSNGGRESTASPGGSLVPPLAGPKAGAGPLKSSLLLPTATNSTSHDDILAVRHHSGFMRESFMRKITDEVAKSPKHANNTSTSVEGNNGFGNGSIQTDAMQSISESIAQATAAAAASDDIPYGNNASNKRYQFPVSLISKKNTTIYMDNFGEEQSCSLLMDDDDESVRSSGLNRKRNSLDELEMYPPLTIAISRPSNNNSSSSRESVGNNNNTSQATTPHAMPRRMSRGNSQRIPARSLNELQNPNASNDDVETPVLEGSTQLNPSKPPKDEDNKMNNQAHPEIPNLLHQYQQKFEKNLLELKEVAKNIMEKFIYLNSEHEINIPQQMKFKTIANFEQSMKLSVEHCMEALYDAICTAKLIEQTIERNEIKHVDTTIVVNSHLDGHNHHGVAGSHIKNGGVSTPSSLARQNLASEEKTSGPSNITGYEEIELWNIFDQSKTEIYKLLNNDCFMRWKNTTDFKALIDSFKPYEQSNNNAVVVSNDNLNSIPRILPHHQSFEGSIYTTNSNRSGFQANSFMNNSTQIRGMGGGYNNRRPLPPNGGVVSGLPKAANVGVGSGSVHSSALGEVGRISSNDSMPLSDIEQLDNANNKDTKRRGLVGLAGLFQKKGKGVAISG